MKYEKMIQSILKEVGGQENIESVYHCATRLRFQLKDETKENDEAVKAIDGVLSIVKGGGQYQIVIGQHVADVYNELQTMMGTTENEIELKDAKEFKQEMKKKKISNQFIDVISGVFTPVLGMLTATGVIKGLIAFLVATGLLATTSETYQMLNIVGDCFFNFLPIFLGYTSMKKFGGTPFIGMAIGAAFTALFNLNATISGFLYGALIQVCVMFGVHWGFVAISVNNLATLGYDPITIAGLVSGIGGAIIGFGGVKQYVYGTNGIFGWLQVINPQTGFDSSVLAAIIACAVSFIAAIILMMTVGKDSIPESK